MKKILNILLVLLTFTVFFSCNTEEDIVTEETQEQNKQIANKESEELDENEDLIYEILSLADSKLNELSNESYIEIADALREELSEGELNSVESVPLEDLFYIYEGILNYEHIDYNNDDYAMTEEDVVNGDQKMESFNFEFQVDIEPNGNSFTISTSNFNALYGTINQTIIQTKVSAQVTNVLSSNLSLNAVNATTASVSLSLTTGLNATHKPWGPRAVFIPPSTVYGALDAGYCTINGPLVDASDFTRLYANDHVSNPNITTSRPRNYMLFKDLSPGPNFNSSHLKFFGRTVGLTYVGYETPYIWKDFTNTCVGDATNTVNNAAIWNALFADTFQITDIPLQFLINNVDVRYKFIHTTGDSVKSLTYFPSDCFHSYSLTYAIII